MPPARDHLLRASLCMTLLGAAACPRALGPSAQQQPFIDAPRAGFVGGDPQTAGLGRKALEDLIAAAADSRTDALLVAVRGQLIVDRDFRPPEERGTAINAMSVNKSIAALAVGLLIDDGTISSLDDPLSTWFPSWAEGKKASVTLRHAMTHTTGLEHLPADGVLVKQPNRRRFALHSPLIEEPGARFSYNNRAFQIVYGVIEEASGAPVDKLLARRLFRPLGVTSDRWSRDEAGNVYDLSLAPIDLLKVGLMLADDGVWRGRRLLSGSFVNAMTTPSAANPDYGLLWWLRRSERMPGYNANGWLGQFLAVYPDRGLVGVRMRAGEGPFWDQENKAYGFLEFFRLLEALPQEQPRPGKAVEASVTELKNSESEPAGPPARRRERAAVPAVQPPE